MSYNRFHHLQNDKQNEKNLFLPVLSWISAGPVYCGNDHQSNLFSFLQIFFFFPLPPTYWVIQSSNHSFIQEKQNIQSKDASLACLAFLNLFFNCFSFPFRQFFFFLHFASIILILSFFFSYIFSSFTFFLLFRVHVLAGGPIAMHIKPTTLK